MKSMFQDSVCDVGILDESVVASGVVIKMSK